MCNKGHVLNVQRFSSSDGPGIRTVVFLKGCPLNCAWCHNPESKNVLPEIFYNRDLCIDCNACVNVCAEKCHYSKNKTHIFRRKNCNYCKKCAVVCPSSALKVCGEEKSEEEVITTVLRDKPFFDESGGGLTLSGGEPLMQYDFLLSFFKLAKEYGLHTAIETSGFSYKSLNTIGRYTDLWLYDIKLFSDEEHIKYTGVSNKKVFENLALLDEMGAEIILRCPIIPKVNFSEEHFDKIAVLANEFCNVSAIHLEPYHPLGISKANQLNKKQEYKNKTFLNRTLLEPFAKELRLKIGKSITII